MIDFFSDFKKQFDDVECDETQSANVSPAQSDIDPDQLQHVYNMIKNVFDDKSTIFELNNSFRQELSSSHPKSVSLGDVYHNKASGGVGNLNSSLADKATSKIIEILEKKFSGEFEGIDGHGIDFKTSRGLSGDFKIGFTNADQESIWTGNDAEKQGVLVLIKFKLDRTVPLSCIRISKYCIGIIPYVCITSNRGNITSDRTSISIPNENFDNLLMIHGDKIKKDKKISLKLNPTVDDVITNSDRIIKAVEGFELNKIYQEDCLLTMARMKNSPVDLTVTSPPYDVLGIYNGYSFNFEEIAKELFRVTKDGGVVAWIVGDTSKDGTKALNSFRQALFFKDIGFNFHADVYGSKSSHTFILSKGVPKTFNSMLDEDHIISWSNENDLVFDPFMESATTAKRAVLTKRNFVGCRGK